MYPDTIRPLVIDGQLHDMGPRAVQRTNDRAHQIDVMSEIVLASMDAVGVDIAVLHPGDDEWAGEMVKNFPDRFAIVPMLDQTAADPARTVQTMCARDGVVGVRFVIGYPPTGEGLAFLHNGTWQPFLAECEKLGVPAFVFISGFLPELEPVLQSHPDLTVIIDHLGIRQPPTDVPDDPPFSTLPHLLRLAEYPNAYVKVCGLPALSAQSFPYADTWPVLEQLLTSFGSERLFWASDISRFQGRMGWHGTFEAALSPYVGKHTYAQSLQYISSHPRLSDHDKAAILGGTLGGLLGVKGAVAGE